MRTIVLVLFLLICTRSFAQDTLRKVSWYPVPAVGYTPETGTYLGAVIMAQFSTSAQSRKSNVKAEYNGSFRNQHTVDLGWTYFSPSERWISRGRLYFSQFPDYYYGIGNDLPEENEVHYSSQRIGADVDLLKRLGNWFAGPIIHFRSFDRLEYLGGNETTYATLYPGRSIGFGAQLVHDSRNQVLHATSGSYLALMARWNEGPFGSYGRFSLDGRTYGTWKKLEWALRGYADATTDSSPYFDLPILGGDALTRGIYAGRFRDVLMATGQYEIRHPLFWRIGIAVFGGVSSVASEARSFVQDPWKFNQGVGLRFLIDKMNDMSLRLDYALASDSQTGFYVAFGESF